MCDLILEKGSINFEIVNIIGNTIKYHIIEMIGIENDKNFIEQKLKKGENKCTLLQKNLLKI